MRPRPLTLALAAAALLAVGGCGLLGARAQPPAPIVEAPTASPDPTPTPMVVVDVQGAVARPGVYRLPANARVADALAAAGGLVPEADPAALNRAATLRDGVRIYASVRGELAPAGSLGTEAERLVNVNHASAQELAALPGIGPSTAERIVRAREKAPFRAVEELQTRGFVGSRVLSDIRELVTVR